LNKNDKFARKPAEKSGRRKPETDLGKEFNEGV
jgi:hypothetical protein